MASTTRHQLDLVYTRWQAYKQAPNVDTFIDMTLSLHALGEEFVRLRLSRLARLTEGLESVTLSLMEAGSHPLSEQQKHAIDRQIESLQGAISLMQGPSDNKRQQVLIDPAWAPKRQAHVIYVQDMLGKAQAIRQQINQIGFEVTLIESAHMAEQGEVRAAVLVPEQACGQAELLELVQQARQCYRYAQLFLLDTPDSIETQVELLRAGVDVLIHHNEPISNLLTEILDLTEIQENEPYRILVVEDSRVASLIIQRTLREHGIDSYPVRNPADILSALDEYVPDLVLMDMQMPRFDGVEATRVVRQIRRWRSLPIVYLSGEQDIARQIEALRLGGDQFLTKPFNPVMLAAVVKTRVDRYRTAQRSTQIDGLTGLMAHSAGKQRLELLVNRASQEQPLAVAMVDIDHFKAINDSFGHPFGDRIICSLAWLMRGKLRSTDLIARYGGEEFLVALPGADRETSWRVIENLRQLFVQQRYQHARGELNVSFSTGLAFWQPNLSAADLIRAADSALLEAKQKGRNCVVMATSEVSKT